jgi:hypothetical protein
LNGNDKTEKVQIDEIREMLKKDYVKKEEDKKNRAQNQTA